MKREKGNEKGKSNESTEWASGNSLPGEWRGEQQRQDEQFCWERPSFRDEGRHRKHRERERESEREVFIKP